MLRVHTIQKSLQLVARRGFRARDVIVEFFEVNRELVKIAIDAIQLHIGDFGPCGLDEGFGFSPVALHTIVGV